MNKGLIVASFAVAGMLLAATPAEAQRRRAARKAPVSRSGPEGGLLGVKLFDSGLRVVGLYGNPDSITPVGGAQTGGGPGGGGGGGGRPPGLGGPGGGPSGNPRGGGGAGGGSSPAVDTVGPGAPDPLSGLAGNFRQNQDDLGVPGDNSGGGGRGGAPGQGGRGGGGGGGGTTETADYVRWIYTKSGSKFGFVLDKFNRVIQIEAVGLQNQRVKTRRGISFGSSFSQVIKAYGPSAAPDGYDITGNTVVVKFLTRQRVAFRMSKLNPKQAHVVTGIVVAAGKA